MNLFGGKPSSKAVTAIKQPEKIEQQPNTADDQVKKLLAKKRRATVLNQIEQQPANISRTTLGAG